MLAVMDAMFTRPETLGQVWPALAAGASVIAGGTDWFPFQGERAVGRRLVDITRLPGLRGISAGPDGWRIGAATTWTDIIRAELPFSFNGLKAAAREVGSVQIQNTGTLAGNLCNASPAADGVPPLLTLTAQVELTSQAGVRVIALADFLTGPRKTLLSKGEIVSAVIVPPVDDWRGGFLKVGARRYLVISIAMVAVLVRVAGDARGDQRRVSVIPRGAAPDPGTLENRDTGQAARFAQMSRILEARVSVGSCGPVACRLPAYEAALIGADPGRLPDVTAFHLAPLSPIADIRADSGYRLAAVAEMIPRAIRMALA